MEAIMMLRAAVVTKGDESGEYLPHFYLGIAIRNLGDCLGAFKEFAVLEKDGAIQKTRLCKTLLEQRDAYRKTPQ
jgi:hypothetical protein